MSFEKKYNDNRSETWWGCESRSKCLFWICTRIQRYFEYVRMYRGGCSTQGMNCVENSINLQRAKMHHPSSIIHHPAFDVVLLVWSLPSRLWTSGLQGWESGLGMTRSTGPYPGNRYLAFTAFRTDKACWKMLETYLWVYKPTSSKCFLNCLTHCHFRQSIRKVQRAIYHVQDFL